MDLVSYPARAEGLGKYDIYMLHIDPGREVKIGNAPV